MGKINNAYPELPEVAYKHTKVEMPIVVAYIKTLSYPLEVKRMTYCIFRIESGNGSSGVNNNYCGIQADGSRLGGNFDKLVTGTCVLNENMKKKPRRFCCFEDFKPSIDYLAAKVAKRGMYIGGTVNDQYSHVGHVDDVDELDLAYIQEWVEGDPNAHPDSEQYSDMHKMYNSATIAIS
jgi:hypothetical protein